MNKTFRFIGKYAEYYIVLLILLCGYSPYSIHPVALLIAAGLVLQIIYKNEVVGFVIATIFVLINLFMLLAVISEFNEFPTGSVNGYVLLLTGMAIIALNLIIAHAMFKKYSSTKRMIISN